MGQDEFIDDDRLVVARAKQGDFAAFEALVEKYEKRIFALSMRLLRNHEEAEDVTQKTFLSVVEHLKDFREESPFAGWLLRIATNHGLKVLRKRRGLDVVSARTADTDEDYAALPHPDFIAAWRESPEKLAADRQTQELMVKAMGELPENLRVVFLLRDVEGMSTDETAEALGIKAGAVKVRLLRARLELRERLTRELGDSTMRVNKTHAHGKDDKENRS